jgi:hypothetical protein
MKTQGFTPKGLFTNLNFGSICFAWQSYKGVNEYE